MTGVVRPGAGQSCVCRAVLLSDVHPRLRRKKSDGSSEAMVPRRHSRLGCACIRPSRRVRGIKAQQGLPAAIVEKLPPCPFDKADQYRGSVHSFRLDAIEPRTRRLLIGCQIEGEFHPPVTGPISERAGRSPDTPEGWRKFRFEVKASVNIEPGNNGRLGFVSKSTKSSGASLTAFRAWSPGFWASTSMSW